MIGVEALRREWKYCARGMTTARPGPLQTQNWGLEFHLTDSFGNRIRFCHTPAAQHAEQPDDQPGI
jgi:hypothetical protein